MYARAHTHIGRRRWALEATSFVLTNYFDSEFHSERLEPYTSEVTKKKEKEKEIHNDGKVPMEFSLPYRFSAFACHLLHHHSSEYIQITSSKPFTLRYSHQHAGIAFVIYSKIYVCRMNSRAECARAPSCGCVCVSVCVRLSRSNHVFDSQMQIKLHTHTNKGSLCAVSQWQSGRLVYTKNGLWTDKRKSTYAYVCQFYWHGTDGRMKWKSDADAARAFTAISLFAAVSCVFLPSCREYGYEYGCACM